MHRLLIALLFFPFTHAQASSEAVKPRELVHPYPATGPVEIAGTVAVNKVLRTMQRYAMPAFTDVLALHVAQTLQGESDDPVRVTRRPRQDGNEAVAAVSSAAADGRTLLLASGMAAASSARTRSYAPADRALQPVALVASMPYVLIASGESSLESVGAVIREARAARDRILIASAGERSAGHLAMQLLRSRYGLSLEPVAYNGGTAALQAVATKQVSTALVPLPAVLPYLGNARVKVLATAAPRRHPSIPHVETTAEAGLTDFEAVDLFGVFAPARTPPSVIRELNVMLARSPQSEPTRQFFSELGLRLEH
jgi:tripartite-type tricarboxylate transporter receptor subunit TctC